MPTPAPLLPSIGQRGWVRLAAPELPVVIWVRFEPSASGTLERRELLLEPEGEESDPYSPAVLRHLASILERLKVWANSPDASESILADVQNFGPDPLWDVKHYRTDVHKLAEENPDHPLVKLRSEDRPGAPEDEPGPRRQRQRLAGRARLKIPAERPYPDEFYAKVAALYTDLAWRSSSPAKDIGEAYDVPTRTVHGWVARARELGFLGEGRKGQIG